MASYNMTAHASRVDKEGLAPNEKQLTESPQNTSSARKMPGPSLQTTETYNLTTGEGNDHKIIEENKEGDQTQGLQRNEQSSFQEADQRDRKLEREIVEDVLPTDDGSWEKVNYPSDSK
jgi:hypothetical protein